MAEDIPLWVEEMASGDEAVMPTELARARASAEVCAVALEVLRGRLSMEEDKEAARAAKRPKRKGGSVLVRTSDIPQAALLPVLRVLSQ